MGTIFPILERNIGTIWSKVSEPRLNEYAITVHEHRESNCGTIVQLYEYTAVVGGIAIAIQPLFVFLTRLTRLRLAARVCKSP